MFDSVQPIAGEAAAAAAKQLFVHLTSGSENS
jgi:hypothetical protein